MMDNHYVERIKQIIHLLKAATEGKKVEYCEAGSNKWQLVVDFVEFGELFGLDHDFRIKPEPEYVPFTWDDRHLLRGIFVKSKISGNEFFITGITGEGVFLSGAQNSYTYQALFDRFTLVNDEPCGKKVEG